MALCETVRGGVAAIREGDGVIALRNLADAGPDPWLQIETDGPWCYQYATTAFLAFVAGHLVSPEDEDAAIAAHEAHKSGRYEQAGLEALKIRDTMVRGRVLDAVEGWAAAAGEIIEETAEGTLSDVSDEDIRARLLSVTCPSTGRQYGLLVPAGMSSVADARRWANRGVTPEVES